MAESRFEPNEPSSFRLRPMRRSDLAAGLRLSRQAGWNQTRADWARLLAWETAGCFVAEVEGTVVGTVTTTVYGERLAWVGMMLVDEAHRRQGVGRRLLGHALDWLGRIAAVQIVSLDATPLGQPLYEQADFVGTLGLWRYQGAVPAVAVPPGPRPILPADLPRLAALDADVFGADRRRVVRDLVAAHPTSCFLLEADGVVQGYACRRPGARCWYVGPLVAQDAATAEVLLRAVLAPLAGKAAALDVFDANAAAVGLAGKLGLRPVRPYVRMARGQPLPTLDVGRYFASAGPEIG
jgi:GNAT superfamily N-acetyltransferase